MSGMPITLSPAGRLNGQRRDNSPPPGWAGIIMVVVSVEGVGARLRQFRKLRGLTQQQLAVRAHFSESLIKKIEQGSTPASAAFVSGAARALGVRPAELYGVTETEALTRSEIEPVVVQELRLALDAHDDPRPEGDPLSLDAAARRLDVAARQVHRLRYAEVGAELPGLLHHLYALAEADATAGEQARALLHDAYRMAATIAGRYRQPDLAAVASERHQQLAPRTGDPLRVAISGYHRSTHHLQHGTYPAGLRVLERAHRYVDDTPAGHAVAIQLHLRAAVTAARDADTDTADGHIEQARAISREHHPPPVPYYNVNADPLNIAVHWCAVPVENYDGAEAVRRGDQVRVADSDQPERIGHHHIDQARAWLLYGDRDRTLAHLNDARRIAPQNTRQHPQVRETVLALADADRRVTDSLAGFARWAGIAL